MIGDKTEQEIWKSRRRVLAIVVTIGLLTAFLSSTPFGWTLEQRFGLHWLFTLRGELASPAEVLIVDMDKQSAVELGQSTRGRGWRSRWQRSLHACLVDALTAAGAALIAFDVSFTGEHVAGKQDVRDGKAAELPPDLPPTCLLEGYQGDRMFAEAIARSGNVILAEELVRETVPLAFGSATHEQRVRPLAMFASQALGTAPFPLPDTDSRLDYFWTFRMLGSRVIPSLPVLAIAGLAPEQLSRRKSELSATPSDTTQLQDVVVALRERLLRQSHSVAKTPTSETIDFAGASMDRAMHSALRVIGGERQRYLRFFGPAGTVKYIPYQHAMSGESDTKLADVDGRVVFVGALDLARADQVDSFKTVFSSRDGIDLSGVEVAATAFVNLLTDSAIVPVAPGVSVLIVYTFAAITTLLVANLTLRYAVAGLCLLSIAYVVGACYLFTDHYVWLPLFFPLVVALPLAAIATLIYRYLREQFRGETLDQAIRYYVPDDAVTEFQPGGKPHQRRKVVYGVCMCSDVADYTSLTETIEPNDLVELDNEYFENLGVVIESHRGQRLDLTGDGSLSLWEATDTADQARLEACLAALEMISASNAFNQRHPGNTFETRIGLHAGLVTMANIGGGGHYAYKAVGDVPPTASRIESLNKDLRTHLLASEEVVEKLDQLLRRRVGGFVLKGKSGIIRIYEILGRQDTATPEQLALARRFGAALDLFESCRWQEAEFAFESVLKDFPQDGPSEFYATRSRLNRKSKSSATLGPEIRQINK